MSPAIYSRQQDDRRSTDNNSHTTAILIASIVIAVVVILGVIAFLCYNRRGGERQYREACQKDPYLTRKEFARRKRLSALERIEEDEMQRSVMIRKSLTSRSSNYPVDNSDNDSALNQAMAQVPHSNLCGNSDWAPSSHRGRAVSHQEPHRGDEVNVRLTPDSRSRSPSPSTNILLRSVERSNSQPPHPDEFGRPYHGLPSMLHRPPSFEVATREGAPMPISGRAQNNTRRNSPEKVWFTRG
ncbi:hypothetical protein VD0004_g2633 [Verticillium dahliae]|nr:hypothetical protein VD0004_g2633 [Verticillium dahliae]PNH75373.1 hypothetical protein VD0001_g2164 [Verticillium dahliae]